MPELRREWTTVFLEPGHGSNRQRILWIHAAERGAGHEATLGGQLVEVGGRTETLCGVAVIFGPLPAEQVHGRPDALGQHGSLAGPVVVNEDHHRCDPSRLIRSQPTSAFQVLLLKLGVALLTIGMMRLRAIVSRPG